MLSIDVADKIASSFLAHYYNEFTTSNRVVTMTDLYTDSSYAVMVDLGQETPTLARGKSDIAMHLARLEHTLGQRKVEIITADHVPLIDNGIQIICQGIMYLRHSRRVFLHAFVLAPTPYRPSTFYIVSDYLRFVNAEEEVIPAGAVVLSPDQVAAFLAEEARRQEEQTQRQQLLEFQQRLRAQHAKAAAEEAVREIAIPAPASKRQLQAQPAAEATAAAAETPAAPERDANHGAHGNAEGRGSRNGRGRGSYADAAAERPEHEGRGGRGYRGEGEGRGYRGEVEERRRGGRGGRGEDEGRGYRGGRGEGEERRGRGGRGEGEERRGRGGRGEGEGTVAEGAEARRRGGAGRGQEAEGDKKTDSHPKEGRRAERRSGPSPFLRLCYVPKVIKLSEVRKELTTVASEAPKDAYWFGSDSSHAVVEFSAASVVDAVVKAGKVKIGDHELDAVPFYP